MVDVGHNIEPHKCLDHINATNGHAVRKVGNGDCVWNDNLPHDLFHLPAIALFLRALALAFSRPADRSQTSDAILLNPIGLIQCLRYREFAVATPRFVARTRCWTLLRLLLARSTRGRA